MEPEVKSQAKQPTVNKSKYAAKHDRGVRRPSWSELLEQAGYPKTDVEVITNTIATFKEHTAAPLKPSKYISILAKTPYIYRPRMVEKRVDGEIFYNDNDEPIWIFDDLQFGIYYGLIRMIDLLIAAWDENTLSFKDGMRFITKEEPKFKSDRILGTLYRRWFCPFADGKTDLAQADNYGFYHILLILQAYYAYKLPEVVAKAHAAQNNAQTPRRPARQSQDRKPHPRKQNAEFNNPFKDLDTKQFRKK